MRLATSLAAVLVLASPLAAQEPNFGRAIVATAAEIIVGQPVNWYGPGTVYAFRSDGSGRWAERQRLIASDSARMDDFGRALAIGGNTLAVGAPRKRDGRGVAYRFSRATPAAAWEQAAIIEAPAGGQFGTALALVGDDLLVGAPGDGAGAVYHYRRDGMTGAPIRPAGGGAELGFGTSLAVDGDWLLVGAPAADSARGGLYIVRRQDDGSWGIPVPITVPRALLDNRARLGAAVLLAGDRAWASAPGSTLVIELARDGDSWRPTGMLQPFDGGRGSGFGAALALVDNEVWVGAPGSNSGNGHVYRFVAGSGGGHDAAVRFTADSADGTNWPFAFGYGIASTGTTAIVSMPSRDFGEGRVLVARRDGDGWTPSQQLTGEIHVLGGGAAPTERCADGKVGVFTCSNVEVVAHLPTSALGGARGAWVNDVWGWTDPATQRDYALVARRDGISFVEVTDPAAPRVVGDLPRTAGSPPSVWRDVKVIDNHAYIVADGSGAHGVQVFDLTRLRAVRGAAQRFAPDTTYHEIFSAHNIVADTASKHLYVVGANSGGETCGGGLHIIDARQPEQLAFLGCYTSRSQANTSGYTHDAQCVVYRGPDAQFRGREICVGSNASEINIADVTDKANPVLIGRNSYPNVAYAHQGWFDDEQRYFYMNDEIDELTGNVEGTRTIVWDLAKLDDPVVATMYIGPVMSSDHNLFVVGDRVYESNYGSGLRVLDISDRTNPREIAHFDSAPMNDDGPGHSSTQSGAWSNYPFFKSGVVVFTSVREGLFIVRVNPEPVP
jgi:choice-of-anchor B domain-containing protein